MSQGGEVKEGGRKLPPKTKLEQFMGLRGDEKNGKGKEEKQIKLKGEKSLRGKNE